MPKSKRAKIVPLTKVKAKRRELKAGLVENLRDALDGHAHAYVFTYANMRTSHFKDMRSELAGAARFFLGKNRVMQKALAGADGADEHRPGLAALAADLRGPVGLLLTSKPRAEVEAYFAAHAAPDYARAGAVADRDVVVPRGKLGLPHTMVDELRKLGMTGLKLDKGVPTLPLAYTICSAGDALTPEQCRLLKHFGHQLSVFRLRVVSQWTAEGGAYERIASAADAGAAEGGDDEEMDGEDDDGSDDE